MDDAEFELIETLTEHEVEILALFAQPHTNREIEDMLYLSQNTVKWYARQSSAGGELTTGVKSCLAPKHWVSLAAGYRYPV